MQAFAPENLETSEAASPNRFWLTPEQQLGFQEFRYQRSYRYPERLQDEYVIVLPLSGEVCVREGGRVEEVRPGQVLIGNSRQWRASRYGSDGGCTGLTLIASRRFVQSVMVALGSPEFQGRLIPVFPGVLRIPGVTRAAEDICGELVAGVAGRDYLLDLLAREVLIRCLRAWPSVFPQSPSSVDRVLSRRHYVSALDYMQTCGKADFSIAQMTGHLGVSPEEFTRLFRASTGTTPLRMYNLLLIDRANALFRNGTGTVKEVAGLLKFQSLSHFSSLYKKLTGRSPAALQGMFSDSERDASTDPVSATFRIRR